MAPEESNGLAIEELSTLVDLPVRTIRYYITEGLIAGPRGRGKGALYGDDQLTRLRLIRRLSDERLPLAEIRVRLAGLTTAELAALLREEESRSTEIQLARWAPSAKDYIAALLRNARAAPDAPALSSPIYDAPAPLRSSRSIEESVGDFSHPESTPIAAERWEHWELAPGIVLQVRADARRAHRDLIDRLLRDAEQSNRSPTWSAS